METKRKGARSTKDIPEQILVQLHAGTIETVNLVEWLAIDQKKLLEILLKNTKRLHYLKPIITRIEGLKKQTVTTINDAIGNGLLEQTTLHKDKDLFSLMAKHTSDSIRCWSTYFIGNNTTLTVVEMLKGIQAFAADTHFGVREIAWMAVRPSIAQNLTESIAILSKWTMHKDANIRRFASEATRPRGVWCAHIEALKQNPALGLPILEPLKTDAVKYVQDSVANWLNDASKTQPQFVKDICKKWAKESKTKETAYIIKRALRSMRF
jgi:3-methyladenine DNA glycosylase AlkC